MRPPGSAAELEARRRRAAEHFQERKPLREIASLFGVSLTSVKRWMRTWKAEGVEGLAAKPHPGPDRKLSEKQRRALTEILLQGPVVAGYRTDLWSCARVSEVVRKQFGISYHPAHMGRVLHDLAFRPRNRGAWLASKIPYIPPTMLVTRSIAMITYNSVTAGANGCSRRIDASDLALARFGARSRMSDCIAI